METDPKDGNKKLQDELVDSAHRIWLAGLGALSAAQEEGSKVFDRLVERGKDVEVKTKDQTEKVRDKAEAAWSNVGDKIDEKLTSALNRLGVPTRDEIRNLTQKIEELNAKVEQLKPRAAPQV